ncbi:hypothetical protein EDB86DRAFT_2980782, partial [Lactarius hatsudake]
MSRQWAITRAPRPRHIPNLLNISREITARTEGEADKPAFENGDTAEPTSSPSATPSGSMVPTANEGWFSDMPTLVANQRWVFGAAGI